MEKMTSFLDYLSRFCNTHKERLGVVGIYLFYGITPALILSKSSDLNSIAVSVIMMLLGLFVLFLYSYRNNPKVEKLLDFLN